MNLGVVTFLQAHRTAFYQNTGGVTTLLLFLRTDKPLPTSSVTLPLHYLNYPPFHYNEIFQTTMLKVCSVLSECLICPLVFHTDGTCRDCSQSTVAIIAIIIGGAAAIGIIIVLFRWKKGKICTFLILCMRETGAIMVISVQSRVVSALFGISA